MELVSIRERQANYYCEILAYCPIGEFIPLSGGMVLFRWLFQKSMASTTSSPFSSSYANNICVKFQRESIVRSALCIVLTSCVLLCNMRMFLCGTMCTAPDSIFLSSMKLGSKANIQGYESAKL